WPHRPGQFRGGEPQQPLAQLLLPAAAPGSGLLAAAAVLPQPPAVPAQRAPRAGRPQPSGTADGPSACPLAGTARPAGPLRQLTENTRQRPQQGTRNSPSRRA